MTGSNSSGHSRGGERWGMREFMHVNAPQLFLQHFWPELQSESFQHKLTHSPTAPSSSTGHEKKDPGVGSVQKV